MVITITFFSFQGYCKKDTVIETVVVQRTHNTSDSANHKPIQIVIVEANQVGANAGILFGVTVKDHVVETTFDTVPCNLAKYGVVEASKKREGDNRTPSGFYKLGPAFGYTPDTFTNLRFVELTENHYWVDDPNSPNYNQLVIQKPQKESAEKMKRQDGLYKYGLVIQYNTDPVEKNKGSAIFIHVEKGVNEPTAGCVSISEISIKALLEWIETDSLYVFLSNERPTDLDSIAKAQLY